MEPTGEKTTNMKLVAHPTVLNMPINSGSFLIFECFPYLKEPHRTCKRTFETHQSTFFWSARGLPTAGKFAVGPGEVTAEPDIVVASQKKLPKSWKSLRRPRKAFPGRSAAKAKMVP